MVEIPSLMASNSSLAPFSFKLLGEDASRLAPVGVVVVVLALIAIVVWLREQRSASKENRKVSVKRGL